MEDKKLVINEFNYQDYEKLLEVMDDAIISNYQATSRKNKEIFLDGIGYSLAAFLYYNYSLCANRDSLLSYAFICLTLSTIINCETLYTLYTTKTEINNYKVERFAKKLNLKLYSSKEIEEALIKFKYSSSNFLNDPTSYMEKEMNKYFLETKYNKYLVNPPVTKEELEKVSEELKKLNDYDEKESVKKLVR